MLRAWLQKWLDKSQQIFSKSVSFRHQFSTDISLRAARIKAILRKKIRRNFLTGSYLFQIFSWKWFNCRLIGVLIAIVDLVRHLLDFYDSTMWCWENYHDKNKEKRWNLS